MNLAKADTGTQGTQDMVGFREELAQLTQEIKAVKSMLSTALVPRPPEVGMPRAANVQVLDSNKTKVMWGCS